MGKVLTKDEVEQSVRTINAWLGGDSAMVNELRVSHEALRVLLQRLATRLEKYGSHQYPCTINPQRGIMECSCGLNAHLSDARTMLEDKSDG